MHAFTFGSLCVSFQGESFARLDTSKISSLIIFHCCCCLELLCSHDSVSFHLLQIFALPSFLHHLAPLFRTTQDGLQTIASLPNQLTILAALCHTVAGVGGSNKKSRVVVTIRRSTLPGISVQTPVQRGPPPLISALTVQAQLTTTPRKQKPSWKPSALIARISSN